MINRIIRNRRAGGDLRLEAGGATKIPSLVAESSIKTSAYTAKSGDRIFADTSGGAFTITLPPTPSSGDEVEIFDPTDDWDVNNVIVARNGENINGAASDFTLDVEGGRVLFKYYNVTQGWKTY